VRDGEERKVILGLPRILRCGLEPGCSEKRKKRKPLGSSSRKEKKKQKPANQMGSVGGGNFPSMKKGKKRRKGEADDFLSKKLSDLFGKTKKDI